MILKPKYLLAAFGIVSALGIGLGLSPRAITTSNDIIFGENGPIKLISPDGVVLLTNKTQTITSDNYIYGGSSGVRKYAFFILDLNDGFPLNDGGEMWLGVELKASTNNFGMALQNPTYEDKNPCYWSCTESQYQGSDESMSFVVSPDAITLGNGYDNRGWIRIFGSMLDVLNISSTNITDDLKFPRKIGVLVGPEMLRTTEDNPGWLRSDNDEIVWSYMRTDLVNYETNVNGKAIWTMCEPACWFDSIPKWATYGVNSDEHPVGN